MRKLKVFLSTLLLTVASVAFAQNITVKGVVTDASNGEPLSGAAILVKGTPSGTVADIDGRYSITVPANATLGFTTIGFKDAEIAVNGRAEINVSLEPNSELLKEVVVVAFGTATKESFTGSATTVKSDELAKVQTSDPTRALEGVVAGVQMTTASGSLSASPSIQIRGIASISAGTSPLYVVDGVPYDGDLNNINMSDIESMTVLKDAASNSLYGARGANGVIMITTKKAKSGDAIVTVDAKVGVNSKALQSYDYITDPAQYYETYYGALYNYYTNAKGFDPTYAWQKANQTLLGTGSDGGLGYDVYTYPQGQYLIGTNGKLNPNATLGKAVKYGDTTYYLTPDNWMNETYRNSVRQEYNVNVSAGNDRGSIFTSVGYLNNNGIIEGESMTRFTARIRADYQVKSWLKVGGNMSYAHYTWDNANSDEGSAGSVGNIFAFATHLAPIYPVYMRSVDDQGNVGIMIDEHGLKRYDYGGGLNAGLTRPFSPNSNALQSVTLDAGNTVGNDFTGTGFAEVKFLKDFTFTINAGTHIDGYRGTSISNMWYGQFVPDGGTIQKSHGRTTELNFQQLLTYRKTIANKHNLDVLVGHENYNRTTESLSGYKKNLFSMKIRELNGAVVDGQGAASSISEYNVEGYFARLQYNYKEKYFVSASYRRDASSRFNPEHRWGNFWSAGAGWLINKESWFKAPWVDMLKLKASIGQQGNDNIGSYQYIDTYSISNNEGQVAVSFANKGNENISWETMTNINAGVDFELFDGRLNGTAEYFYGLRKDLLFWFTVPASLGYSGYYDNIGDMRNQGVEFSLDGSIIKTRNIEWRAYANVTSYTNKILYLPEERKTVEIEGYKGYASGNKFIGEGLPLRTFYMQKYAGLNKENGKPTWYKDEKDDEGNITGRTTTEKYSEATKYLTGDCTPKAYGGFGTSLHIGDFDLSASFTYSIGGLVYDSGYAAFMTPPASSTGVNFHKDVLNAWSKDNPDSDIPRFQYGDTEITATSDYYLVDASYLNFQRAQIGYTFPTKLTNKIKISKIRLYVTCDNICYWSYRKGLDPRQSFTGSTGEAYASPIRTLSGGLNITF